MGYICFRDSKKKKSLSSFRSLSTAGAPPNKAVLGAIGRRRTLSMEEYDLPRPRRLSLTTAAANTSPAKWINTLKANKSSYTTKVVYCFTPETFLGALQKYPSRRQFLVIRVSQKVVFNSPNAFGIAILWSVRRLNQNSNCWYYLWCDGFNLIDIVWMLAFWNQKLHVIYWLKIVSYTIVSLFTKTLLGKKL